MCMGLVTIADYRGCGHGPAGQHCRRPDFKVCVQNKRFRAVCLNGFGIDIDLTYGMFRARNMYFGSFADKVNQEKVKNVRHNRNIKATRARMVYILTSLQKGGESRSHRWPQIPTEHSRVKASPARNKTVSHGAL